MRGLLKACRIGSVGIGCAAGWSASGCEGRATQIVLQMESNVGPERPITVTLTVLDGAHDIGRLRAAPGARTVVRSAEGGALPGSVAIVPREGRPRAGTVSLLAVFEAEAFEGQPAVRIERWQQMALVERVPQQARVFFNVRCSSLAIGCEGVSASECTVSRRCIERGQTCGDEGECVSVVLPTTPIPPGTSRDASQTRDVSGADAPARPADAGIDARADATIDVGRDGGAAGAPRLLAPSSTNRVTSPRAPGRCGRAQLDRGAAVDRSWRHRREVRFGARGVVARFERAVALPVAATLQKHLGCCSLPRHPHRGHGERCST